MAKARFKADKAGYRALMQQVGVAAISPHVQRLEASANALARHEGAEYGSKVSPIGTKSRMKVPYGIVHTVGAHGAVDNSHYNTLARALGGS